MKHGGTVTALSLVLAFAHHVRLCTPFSSVAPWQSSRAQPSQAGTHRSAWALEAATTSEAIARREDMLQAKRAAKEKLVAQRIRTLQQLLPGLDAYMLVYKSPRLLTSAHLSKIVPSRLAAMERLLPGVDVQRLVKLNPDLLLYDVEKTLAPRIMHLKRLFPESPKLLMRAPALLLHDTETFLIPKIEELGSLLPGIDVLRLVRREPTILYLDISRTVKQRLKSLAELLPGQNVTAMVGKVPRLLTSDVSGMAQKLSSLRWLLGPDADLKKIVHRKPDLLLSNVETTVAAKFRELQHLFPEGDVVSMVERDATVLFYDFEKSINVKVDCWRERVSNVTELDDMITAYPVLLSYSLDTTVSRLDFLIQTNGTQMNASKLRQVSQTPRRDWDAAHGDKYRKFLERKVEGPSVLRLWPGLYFDSDTFTDGDGDPKGGSSPKRRNRVEGEGLAVRLQDDGSVATTTPSAAALKAATAHVKSLERQYGSNIKETQLRFSSALRRGKHGANPTEMDMILYDIKSFDQQVRKLAMGTRMKRFRELLPGLNADKLFKDFPQVVMMDLKKVEERVQELRELLCGSDVSSAVSIAPNLLLNDVQTCLRPRMTRLVVALSAKQLEGVLDADKVKGMVVRCPQLLLSDVRNVVVPSLQYMLRSTSDHSELAKRIFRDPSLLVVGVGPLARLQYTLEQYRDGTASVSLGRLDTTLPPPPPPASPLAATLTDEADTTNIFGAAATAIAGTGELAKADAGSIKGEKKGKRRRTSVKKAERAVVQPVAVGVEGAGEVRAVGEDQSRLLPPVVVPQILKCQLRDFVDRNPSYVAFLAQRQGLPLPLPSTSVAGGDGVAEGVQTEEAFDGGSQAVFWERAVGARLSQTFRPADSPYALMKKEAGGKGPAGQKGAQLSELDLLVGDVLYFNHRMGVLASKIQIKMPPTVDLRQEATKLAEDVQWGSRQIRRLLGLGSWTEREAAEPPSESNPESFEKGDGPLPPLPATATPTATTTTTASTATTTKPPEERRKKRQWVSDTFQSLWEHAGRNGADLGVHTAVQAVVEGGGDRETAQELERLLGEVSGYEGRLEGLLDLPISSSPANADDTLPSEDGVESQAAAAESDAYPPSTGQLGGESC